MLQLLANSNTITPNTTNSKQATEFINSYIDKYACQDMKVDISCLNIIDACYVTTMCSTKHYIKYPTGKINWKVSSSMVQELNKKLDLGNCTYEV